jgi:hypothetical protein
MQPVAGPFLSLGFDRARANQHRGGQQAQEGTVHAAMMVRMPIARNGWQAEIL